MKKALTSAKITRPLWMSYKDYMPWPNEHCTVGTTYDAMMDRENKPDRVFVSKHVIDTEYMWENSSANSEISEVSEVEQSNSVFAKDKPSTVHFRSKAPPLREGLFRSVKKQTFRRLP